VTGAARSFGVQKSGVESARESHGAAHESEAKDCSFWVVVEQTFGRKAVIEGAAERALGRFREPERLRER
jgi:hypothetical protein